MLRAGFIGFGRMGITHYSILNSHPSVTPVAICDQSKTMLNILKKHIEVEMFSDYKKMVMESKPDFVVISTPSDSHTEIINYAIGQGIHIFSEKPFAMNAADGQDTLDRLFGKAIVNQVGYVNRFNEVFMEIRNLIHKGVIGEIKQFSSEMYGATVLKDAKGGWRAKKKTGGGCLYEFASHCIDLAVYIFGVPQKVTGSILQSIFSSAVEDYVGSTFIYENGSTGLITVNWSDETFRKPANILKINGTEGKIIADKHAYKIFLKNGDPSGRFHKGWNTVYITDIAESVRFYLRGNEFTRQLDYFIDCIQNNQTENISDFADALQTDIVMDKITRDAQRSLAAEPEDDTDMGTILVSQNEKSLWGKFKSLFQLK